jgi:ABC-2 type transport system ATP-binding protein
MDVIATQQLTKAYGLFTALKDLDLRVGAGALFGFLGPNGAGKTTAIRILLGLLRATRGRATVLDADVWRDGPKLRREIGYLPGDVRFWGHMTGRRTVKFLDAVHKRESRREAERLAEVLSLELDKRVRDYSRGMKQKLGLIAAMMHRPKLLILDEPTTALDPLVRETLYAELRAYVRDGRTVLFSSHTLAEVEELCDEVAILRSGELVEQERIDVLRGRAVRRVELRLAEGAELVRPLPAGLELGEQSGEYVHAAWRGAVEPLVAWLARNKLVDVTIAPPDLDDLFLTYYQRDDAGTAA